MKRRRPCSTCAAIVRIVDALAETGDELTINRVRSDLVLGRCGTDTPDEDDRHPWGRTLEAAVAEAVKAFRIKPPKEDPPS